MQALKSLSLSALALALAAWASGEGFATWRANLAPNLGPQISDVDCYTVEAGTTDCAIFMDGVEGPAHVFQVAEQTQ